jgi:predicted RNA-binding Zn-ribbon protein involved in translation (DUF1610 family)
MPESKHAHYECPQCGHALHRTHRRAIERVVSVLVPLRRYACRECGWSGARVKWSRPRLPTRQDFTPVVIVIVALLFVMLAAMSVAGAFAR